MAVTKIWDVKSRLDHVIDYVTDPDKTYNAGYDDGEQKYFVTAMNCNATCAKRQFQNVKKQFTKTSGIIAYHGYQSFSPGEVSAQEAHRIGVELAEQLWAGRFQVIVSTHVNTDCIHNHLLFNSVSFKDGKKYHDCREAYRKMRETSDRICREHGLSMIEDPESRKDPSNLHRMDMAGMPTRYNVTRQAVDEAIAKSSNLHELAMNLKSLGYTARFQANRKYWTVIPKGWEKPIRLARLGEEYTNERILARLSEERQAIRMEPFQRKSIRPRQYLLMTRKDRLRKVGGLRGLYLRYCYELRYLPKYRKRWSRVHYLLKDDLLRCEQYSKQARLLGTYQIETREDLASFLSDKNAEYENFSARRDELRKVARRVMPEESRAEIKKEITELTEKLKALREEIKLSEDIRERSDKLKENIEKIDKEQEQRKEERGR